MLPRPWFLAVLVAAVAAPAPAADIDKYLLNDTDAVIALNVKQLAEAPLFKKHYAELVKGFLKDNEGLQKELAALGIDPLQTIERVLVVHGESSHRLDPKPGAKGESGMFFLIHGKFDAAKVRARAEQVAQDSKFLKIEKNAAGTIYELAMGQPLYVAMPDATTVVTSPFKDQVVEALEKAAGKKKAALKYKDVQDLIARADDKQALWLAATGRTVYDFNTTTMKVKGKDVTKTTKETLLSVGVESISGGVTVTDGIQTVIVVTAKDAAAAKQVSEFIQQDLNEGVQKAWQAALKQKQFDPLREYLRTLETTTKGKVVTVQGAVTGKAIEDALK